MLKKKFFVDITSSALFLFYTIDENFNISVNHCLPVCDYCFKNNRNSFTERTFLSINKVRMFFN